MIVRNKITLNNNNRMKAFSNQLKLNKKQLTKMKKPKMRVGMIGFNSVIIFSTIFSAILMANNINKIQAEPFRSHSQLQSQQQHHLQQQQPFSPHHGASGSSIVGPGNQMMVKDLSGPTSGKIQTLDVICGKNFMTVRAEFSGPFYGIVFSKGTYGHENCIYVKPNSGLTHAAFNVYYDQCGTKPDLQGKFYENTIVIQYGSDIIEAYDEAKRLRCEWFEAYEKPATFKPAIPVADLEVVEMNFQGDDIDCWMEIQDGTGPWSREVSKIVPVGQPMTIVVAINDYNGQFDMRVKSCVAHDGVQNPIALTDEYGCVLRPKMLTPFVKIKNPGAHKEATILSYSRFLAFKFPDSMTVQIQCTVEVCRNGCAEACQRVPSSDATTLQPGELSLTAKWPGSAHQPSMISGPRKPQATLAAASDPDMANESQYRPSHVQFHGRQAPSSDSQASVGSSSVGKEDMNSMSSNRQAYHFNTNKPTQQQQQQQPEPNIMPMNHGELMSSRRLVQHANSITNQDNPSRSYQQLHVITTLPPVDTLKQSSGSNNNNDRTNSATSDQSNYDIGHPESSVPSSSSNSEDPSGSQASVSSNDNNNNPNVSDFNKQAAEMTNSESQPVVSSTNPEFGQKSPGTRTETSLSNREEQQGSNASPKQVPAEETSESNGQIQQSTSANGDSSNSSNINNNVKANEGERGGLVESAQQSQNEPATNSEPRPQDPEMMQAAASNSLSSSIKTVEVEVPSNTDEQTGAGTAERHQINFPDIPNASYEPSMVPIGGPSSIRQVSSSSSSRGAQAADRRNDKSDREEDSHIDDMMPIVSQKSSVQFGARSPPQSQKMAAAGPVAPAAGPESSASSISSSIPSSSQAASNPGNNDLQSSANAVAPIESMVSSDRILMDRSDDASITLDSDPANPSAKSSDERQGETRPVVGTDELASGQLDHLEDRMGSVAQSNSSSRGTSSGPTLEDELTKLQHQIPQSAALVSATQSQQPQFSQPIESEPLKPILNEQVNLVKQSQSQSQSSSQSQQQQQQSQAASERSDLTGKLDPNRPIHSVRDHPQPYPNIHGQSKIITDPNSPLVSARGQAAMLAQASSLDGASVVIPAPSSMKMSQQPPIRQPLVPESKPEAQITNVPINLGLATVPQVPSMQQFSHQLAFFQQQQQQNQQKIAAQTPPPPSPTPKPSRIRFNLLSPQAALHAVASRILPKTFLQSSENKQQQHAPVNPKFNPQQQPQFQQQLFQQQQQFIPGKLMMPNNNNQQQHGFGVSQQAPPLMRSRRSALEPSGKDSGSGEIGIKGTFMVVTGMDLAFSPNSNDTQMPQVHEGRRPLKSKEGADDEEDVDVIYGVCMPIVSLTFILTCVFWLIVFFFTFCVYMLIKARRQQQQQQQLETGFTKVLAKSKFDCRY